MHAKLLGVLATLATLGAAAPHSAPKSSLFSLKDQSSLAKGVNTDSGICWKACFFEELHCPHGWESRQVGDCWTCCRKEEEEVVTAKTMELDAIGSDICWRACFFEEPTCPDGWESKQFGECWTCCRKDEYAVAKAKTMDVVASGSNICWLVCFSNEATCPEGWESKQFGECWTCCRKDEYAVAKAKTMDVVASGSDICWRACFFENPGCPEGMEPKKLGQCWTCCIKDEQGLSKSSSTRQLQKANSGICWLTCFNDKPRCPLGWEAQGSEGCYTCCLKDHEELVRSTSLAPVVKSSTSAEICLMICFPEAPNCQAPSYPKQFGECWTCCTKIGEDDEQALSHDTPIAQSLGAIALFDRYRGSLTRENPNEVCLLVCFPEQPPCNKPSYPKQFGECWTCCTDLGRDNQVVSLESSKTQALVALSEAHSFSKQLSNGEACLMVCFEEKPECQHPSYAVQFGQCWTCCTKFGEDAHQALSPKKSMTHRPSTQLSVATEICLMACFPEKPHCAAPFFPKEFGECWTCCRQIDDDMALSSTAHGSKAGTAGAVALFDGLHSSSKKASKGEACLMICLPEKPDCGGNAYAKQFGDCWTCCAKFDETRLAVSAAASKPKDLKASALASGPCWAACLPPDFKCPEGTEPHQEGPCTTCCFKKPGLTLLSETFKKAIADL